MFLKIIRLIQVTTATSKAVEIIASNGWLDPTKEQYASVVFQSVKDIRLTEEERQKLVETLLEMKDDIVRESYKTKQKSI
jgi:hypothetical protein